MIELTEMECVTLISALNLLIQVEGDTTDYTAIFNKLQGELELVGMEEDE